MCQRKKYALFPYEYKSLRNWGHLNPFVLEGYSKIRPSNFPIFLLGFYKYALFIKEFHAP